MTNNGANETKDLKQFAASLGDLVKVLGGILGISGFATAVIIAIGFVVTNTRLLNYGAFELSLVRNEFLAAGISFVIITMSTVLLGAMVVLWLEEKVSKPVTVFIAVCGILFLWLVGPLVRSTSAGAAFIERLGPAFVWGSIVALIGGLFVAYLKDKGVGKELAQPNVEFSRVGKPILVGIIFLLVALVTFGGYAYPQIPKSWGGGSPVYVEFAVDPGEPTQLLESLGLEVGDNGLTERVIFLAASPKRIFIVTQQEDTLSFDPNLVKASKFYGPGYYSSAKRHLEDGDWYLGEREWEMAKKAYDEALLIERNLLAARLGRGIAFVEIYLDSIPSGTDGQVSNNDARVGATNDLNAVIKEAEKAPQLAVIKDADGNVIINLLVHAYYHLARVSYYPNGDEDWQEPLIYAIEKDESLKQKAFTDEPFRVRFGEDEELALILGSSEALVLGSTDQEITASEKAMSLAVTARELSLKGEIEQALSVYQQAITLTVNLGDEFTPTLARLRSDFGDLLASEGRTQQAIDEYEAATIIATNTTRYKSQLARLYYETGMADEALTTCEPLLDGRQSTDSQLAQESRPRITPTAAPSEEASAVPTAAPVEQTTDVEVTTDNVICLIIRANVTRDRQEWDGAILDYTNAAKLAAVELGAPTLASEAYYEWARLEARWGRDQAAVQKLERSVWLDTVRSTEAELEADFDPLRELAGYQAALFPPNIVKIESDEEEGTISFLLQVPSDDFEQRVNALTQILQDQDLFAKDGSGLAENFEPLEDSQKYIFYLNMDKDISANNLSSSLGRLLLLPGEGAQEAVEAG
jgi:hypothetical protein